MKTISVHVAADVLVPDYAAQLANVNRFIGRGPAPERAAVSGPHCVVVDRHENEYRAELRAGNLKPADDATAMFAGLKWEPPAPPEPAESIEAASVEASASAEAAPEQSDPASPPEAKRASRKSTTSTIEGK